MFPLCFQKAWQRLQDVVLFTSCHLHTPSLRAESPLPDQRAVKWSWKKDLSTSSPQLSLSLQSAARCQIYSLTCEHGNKNQQKQPHTVVFPPSRPFATHVRFILRVLAVKGPLYELSRHQLSYLSWFLLVETFFYSIHLTHFLSKYFSPLIVPASRVSRGAEWLRTGEQCSRVTDVTCWGQRSEKEDMNQGLGWRHILATFTRCERTCKGTTQ